MNLEQFARAYGGTTDADVQAHIHGALGPSGRKPKSWVRRFDARLRALQAARDATVARYRQAIAEGSIQAPAPPSLVEVAQGDGEAAAAARRVLEKRAARKATLAQSQQKETG
jgi:hypothetical protein